MRQVLYLLWLCLTASCALANQQNYPFKLINQSESDRRVVLAQNNGPAPILVKVSLTPVGATVDPPSPVVVIVKPNEMIPLASIRSATPGKPYRVAMSYKFSIGDPNAVHDPRATYRLPFRSGQTIKVGQVWGGRISTHKTPESEYAVDFAVPVGTPVLAARAGRVIDVDQDFTEGGTDPSLKANHVLLLHEDGTMGLYSHFSPHGATVAFGQWVEAGTVIGYSGNTGYSFGPHLHFSVLTNTRSGDGDAGYLSHPVTFTNSSSAREIVLSQDATLMTEHGGLDLQTQHTKTDRRAQTSVQAK
jgi:murein DD-endopeptidase MepM/ murein hydrolase activator NlpD